jgi:hypothetical protein
MIPNNIQANFEQLNKDTTMKTSISGKIILLFGFTCMIILSCSKQEDNIDQVTIPSVSQKPYLEIGAIVDTGAITTGIRYMETALYEQYLTLKGTADEVTHAMIEVKVAFYVNSDGHIPSGEYTFSNSKTPFTFDSGSLIYSQLFNTKIDRIVGGTIAVSQIGKTYVLSLKVQLDSGMTASQVYQGSLAYTDSHQ